MQVVPNLRDAIDAGCQAFRLRAVLRARNFAGQRHHPVRRANVNTGEGTQPCIRGQFRFHRSDDLGIVQLVQGQIIFGILLIVAGCLVGPGGYSIFRSRSA